MAKFIFEMPDDLAALVEAFRQTRGHKATAVAVRELISTGLEVAGNLGPFERGAKPDVRDRAPIPPSKPAADAGKVQVGPSASKPGSRLKAK